MPEWRRTETEAGYRSGDQGEHGERIRSLGGPTGVGTQVYLSGEGDDGGGQRLAGGGRKPSNGAEELGEATEDIGEGGSDGADIGGLFQDVVQQVLLFGAEMWVVTPRMEQAISGFLHGAPVSL